MLSKPLAGSLAGERLLGLYRFSMTSLLALIMSGFFITSAVADLPSEMVWIISIAVILALLIMIRKQSFWIDRDLVSVLADVTHREIHDLDEVIKSELLEKLRGNALTKENVAAVAIEPGMKSIGKTIRQLNLRAETGSLIIAIHRGSEPWFDPDPETRLAAGDSVILMGNSEVNAQAIERITEVESAKFPDSEQKDLHIENICVVPKSLLDGNTLAGARLRQDFGVTVLGVLAGDGSLLKLKSDNLLKSGDVLALIGDRECLKALKLKLFNNDHFQQVVGTSDSFRQFNEITE